MVLFSGKLNRTAKQQLANLTKNMPDIAQYNIRLPIADQHKHVGGQLSSLSGMGPEVAYRCRQTSAPLGVLKRSVFKPATSTPASGMRYVRALCLSRLPLDCAA